MSVLLCTHFLRRIVTCLSALTLLVCVTEASVHVQCEHVRSETEIASPIAECLVCAFAQSVHGGILLSEELPSIFPQHVSSDPVVGIVSIIESLETLRSLARAPPV